MMVDTSTCTDFHSVFFAENELRSAISAELQLNFLEVKNKELKSFNSRGSRVGLVAPFGSHLSDLVPPPRMFSDPSSAGSMNCHAHSTIIDTTSSSDGSSMNGHNHNNSSFRKDETNMSDQEMTEYQPQQPITVSSSLPKRSALKKKRFGSYPVPSNQMNNSSPNSYSIDVRSSPRFSPALHSSNPLSHYSTQIT